VLLCARRSCGWTFWVHYDSVGDGHFVVIDHVEKVLEEILFSGFYSFIRLDITGR
jgi:hypothetical protein